MKTFLVVFYFLIWFWSLFETTTSLHLWGRVEGIIMFLFFTDLGVLIYSVLEVYGIWEYVSVYASTAIIITLIIAGCYYLENRSMQDQEVAMDLWSQLRDLRAKCNSLEHQIKELKERCDNESILS